MSILPDTFAAQRHQAIVDDVLRDHAGHAGVTVSRTQTPQGPPLTDTIVCASCEATTVVTWP